jgi:hypothetical protein
MQVGCVTDGSSGESFPGSFALEAPPLGGSAVGEELLSSDHELVIHTSRESFLGHLQPDTLTAVGAHLQRVVSKCR